MNIDSPTISMKDSAEDSVDSALEVIKEVVGHMRGLEKGSKIIVKPNLMDPVHSPGVTTSPELIEGICGYFRDKYDEVTIVEAGGYNFRAQKAFEGHGIPDICRRTGAEAEDLCDLDKTYLSVDTSKGQRVQYPFPSILLDDETCLVSLACLKTHVFTGVSLAIKNLWGCIPNRRRTLLHPYINDILARFPGLLPRSIALIDGSVGQDGRGPKMGTAVNTGIMIGSDDLLLGDIAACKVMGIDHESIIHLQLAKSLRAKSEDLRDVAEYTRNILPRAKMKATPNWFDALAIAIYWSPTLCNLVYNSALTEYIQIAVRKTGLSPGSEDFQNPS